MTATPPPAVPVQDLPKLPPDVVAALAARGDLLDTWWPAVLAGCVAVLAALWIVLRRPRWPAVVALVVAVVVGSAAGVNTYAGYFRSADAVAAWVSGQPAATDGHVDQVKVPVRPGSRMAGSTTYVYTPPGYDPTRSYPTLYLLHGTPGTSRDWFTAGDVAHTLDVLIGAGVVPPLVAVAPDLNAPGHRDTECLDSTRGGPQVETYLGDVVAWVDAHYATVADPGHRIVAGMSMGGYCALDQGLRHQDRFGGIVAIEPFGDPGDGGRAMLATREEFDAVSPSVYIPTMTIDPGIPVVLDLAADGNPADNAAAKSLAAQLAARTPSVLLREEPGGHNWRTAARALPYGLTWVCSRMGLTRQ